MAGISAAELETGLAEVRMRLNTVAGATTPNRTELFQALVISIERMMETSVRFAKQTEEMARLTADDVEGRLKLHNRGRKCTYTRTFTQYII